MIGTTLPVLSGAADFDLWWNIAGAALIAMILVCAVAGRVLPARLLRVCWRLGPLAGMVLFAMTFVAYRGSDPDSVQPWVWTVDAVLVTYQVLWMPLPAALIGAVASGLLPALSGLVVLGAVPASVAGLTPDHVSDIAFIVLFAGIRGRLRRLKTTERHARRLDENRVRAAAETRRRGRLAAVVHDEVLATLTAASTFTGHPPAALQAAASHALAMLDCAPFTETGTLEHPVDTAAVRDRVATDLLAIDPRCAVEVRSDPGTMPAPVVEALVAAAAEALRNSSRHAGPDATRRVRGHFSPQLIRLEIADDGPGFDPASIDPARMGLRSSIVARMRSVPGGDARIDARPGRGVRVELSWQI